VDPEEKQLTVKMKDKEGKEVEKTFKLTNEVRIFDETGKVIAIGVFRADDAILVVEVEGELKAMQKRKKDDKTGARKGEKPGG
jgi:uncharacterized protein YuzE